MKILVSILLLILLRTVAFAGTAQVNNIVQMGGGKNIGLPTATLPLGSLSSFIQLSASSFTSTSGNFLMLSRWASTGSSGQYQVTTGKTFRVVGIWYYSNGTSQKITLGFGTAALSSDNTSSAPTGVVYYSAGAGVTGLTLDSNAAWAFLPITAEFPALSFPFVKVHTASDNYNILVMGVEQ